MARRRATRKRRRRVGGTSDKKPQFLNVTVGNNSTSTWTSTIGEVPLLNILNGGTKVLEILKIYMNRIGGSNASFMCFGSRNLQGVTQASYTAALMAQDKAFIAAMQTSGTENYREIDLTDENGNGQLYPAQQIFTNVANGAGTADFWKISFLYRIKNATMQEYVGIINQYVVTNS